LLKDLINIVCEYMIDEIDLVINTNSTSQTVDFMNIKITPKKIGFKISEWSITFDHYKHDDTYSILCACTSRNILEITENELTFVLKIIKMREYEYEIIKEIIKNVINCRYPIAKSFNKCYNGRFTKFRVIDYDRIILVCNIYCMISKFIECCKFNTC